MKKIILSSLFIYIFLFLRQGASAVPSICTMTESDCFFKLNNQLSYDPIIINRRKYYRECINTNRFKNLFVDLVYDIEKLGIKNFSYLIRLLHQEFRKSNKQAANIIRSFLF